MKPIRLKLQNFGPYAGPAVEIDFTRLDPVFLICGDTGAGKTSLFDGLCYALYGDPLGTRKGEPLRALLAENGASTLAEFEFEVRGKRYLARRSPHWYTPRKRGAGFNQPEELHNLLEGGQVVVAKTSEMKVKIEEILGLTHEEFSKILVLPQGEFQKFLEMNSRDREGILQKLFPIKEHLSLTEFAKKRSQAATQELKGLQAQLKEAMGEGGYDPVQAQAAEEACALRLREAERLGREGQQVRDDARQARQLGEQDAKRHAEQDQLRVVEDTFQAGQPQRDALEAELQRARQAARCEAKAVRFKDAGEALKDTQAKAARARRKQEAAQTVRQALQPALDELPGRQERLGDQRVEATKGVQQLNDLKEIGTYWRKGQEAGEALKKAEQAHRETLDQAQTAQQDLDALARVEAARGELQRELDDVTGRLQPMDRLHGEAALARAWPAQEKALGAERARRRAANGEAARALQAEQERVEAKAALREANLAAALAMTLHDGSPCPVCGATSHPAPVQPTHPDGGEAWSPQPPRVSGALATAAQAAWEAQTKAEGQFDQAQAAALAAAGHLREAGWADVKAFDQELKALQGRQAHLQAELKAKAGQLARRATLAEALRTALERVDRARDLRDEANKAGDEARVQRETLEDRLGLKVAVPVEAYKAAKAAQDARLAAIAGLEQEIRDLLDQRVRTDAEVQATTATMKILDELILTHQGALDAAAADLQEALAAAGFPALEDQEQAQRTRARMEAMEADLTGERDLQGLRLARLEVLATELDGRPRPDLATLTAAEKAAHEAFEAALLAAKEGTSELDALSSRRERIKELHVAIGACHLANNTLHALARELDGENSRNLKFSSWALAWWLERILQQSSHRLHKLSGGRYRFELHPEATDQRRSAGLEIDVHDAFANRTRSVRSLSGGEKFLASLSLALGLAEVIQSRAGGIELDALFIDEGFGSLDAATLDQAMTVLDELGQGRMVGVISHVDAMKKDITCQIRVTSGEGGSGVQVVGVTRPEVAPEPVLDGQRPG